ncbi:MAG: O-antigen ligase family protein [Candidatus Marsarchaeota archaeon]|nr:O-antigen ligase family protein [Candidatus Marsarchaeota archaeon]
MLRKPYVTLNRLVHVYERAVRLSLVALGFGIYFLLQYIQAQAAININTWWVFVVGAYLTVVVLALVVRYSFPAFMVWLIISPLAHLFLTVKIGSFPAITFNRVVLYSLAAVMLARGLVDKNLPRLKLLPEWMLLAYVVYVGLCLFIQPRDSIMPLLDVYTGNVVTVFIVYMLARELVRDPKHIRWVVYGIVLVGLYTAVLGIQEHYTGQMWFSHLIRTDIRLVDRDIGKGRAAGPFRNPTPYGVFLILAAYAGFHLMTFTQNLAKKAFFVFYYAACLLGCFWSYTRGAYVAILPMFTVLPLGVKHAKKAYLTLPILTAIGALIAIPLLHQSHALNKTIGRGNKDQRIVIAYSLLEAIKDRPFLGYGLNNVDHALATHIASFEDIPGMLVRGRLDYPQPGLRRVTPSHCSFLTVFTESGLIGGLLFYGAQLLFLIYIIRRGSKLPPDQFHGRNLIWLIFAFAIGYYLSIAVYDVRFFAYPQYVLFILFAVAIRAIELAEAVPTTTRELVRRTS